MKSFKIVNKKKEEFTVLVDDEDYISVQEYRWYVSFHARATRKIRHVVTTVWDKKTKKHDKLTLHHFIFGKKKGLVVDHIDGNPLNNQKNNLQHITNRENILKSELRLTKRKDIPYKGVSFINNISNIKNPYKAKIRVNTKDIHLGCYKTPEEAAEAYNEAAIKYFGKFTNLNKIPDKESNI